MNLVIDQGNTFIKIGVFDKGKLTYSDSSNFFDENLFSKVKNRNNINKIILSSVKQEFNNTDEILKILNLPKSTIAIILNSKTKIPITNCYETPETLGKDRLAALVGASEFFPGNPKLVIDAGTAITIDYLDEHNKFIGGNISPGIQTRFKSLHQNTGKLPLLQINENSPFIGLNTTNAIQAGVQNSVIFEIDHYINHFNSINNNTQTILTGGDAYFFVKKLKNRIFVNQNLVLTGLNTILEYNV